MGDVVLGYDLFAGYLGDGKTYFGAIVGRYGNHRHGEFKLDGKTYEVPKNNDGNFCCTAGSWFDKLVEGA